MGKETEITRKIFRSKNIWAQVSRSNTDKSERDFKVVINCDDRKQMEAIQHFLVEIQNDHP